MYSKTILLFFTILLLQGTAFAGRPLITDNAETQGKGRSLVEFGFDYARDDDATSKAHRRLYGLEFDYGLTDNIDLTVSSGYQSMNTRNSEAAYSQEGITDTLLEIKWRFYDNGKGLGLAVKPALFLPTGNSDRGWGSGDYRFGTGEVRYRLNLVASQDFKHAAFHVNLGYLRNENRYGARENLWHASLASELKLFRQLRLVANVGMDTAPDIGSSVDSVWALGGFIYSPTDALSFALGLKHGFNDPGYDFAVNSGVSYKF